MRSGWFQRQFRSTRACTAIKAISYLMLLLLCSVIKMIAGEPVKPTTCVPYVREVMSEPTAKSLGG